MNEIFYNNFKIKNVSRTFPKYIKYAAHFYFLSGKHFLNSFQLKKYIIIKTAQK